MQEYKVGQDLITDCGKCKQRTYHVVFAMEAHIVRRVQCKICQSYHNYKPDKVEKAVTSSIVKRQKQGSLSDIPKDTAKEIVTKDIKDKKQSKGKKASAEKDWWTIWSQETQGKDVQNMVNYRSELNYEEGSLINHTKFGVGVVTNVSPLPGKKMEVLFQDGPKVLACRY